MLFGSLGVVAAIVLVVIIAIIVAAKYRTVVPTNMVHIVNSSSGRRVYGKDSEFGNTYYSFPDWIPKIGVNVTQFPTSNFGVELLDYAAYDHKRLPFQVDVQAFFVMENADIVSQRVSDFRELKDHLQKIVSGAVRKVTASLPLERILSARSELSLEFGAEVSEQLKDWGVKAVNSIEFMNIKDANGSTVIQDIQQKEESRINRESREVQAENEQAAKIKEIEAQRKVAMEQENAAQQVGTRTAEKNQAVGIAQEQSKQAVAEQNKLTTEKNMEVKRIEETRAAEIAKEVALTQAEQKRQEITINAESQKVAEITEAEAEKQKQVLAAQASKEAAELKAEADKIAVQKKAEAEKQALELKAEADKKAQELKAEADKLAVERKAEADQKSVQLSSEAQLEADKRKAEGTLAIQDAEAVGIKKIGTAKADAEKEMQMASVTAQTELANQIGDNENYQTYLLQVKQIEVNGEIGIAQAKALESANIQIVGGSGTDGGLSLGGMLTGLVATDAGKAIVERVAGKSI